MYLRSFPPFGILLDMSVSLASSVSRLSPPESKIALFRSLFKGRDDIYSRRFESRKTGKSGYQPACANEWVRGLCDKRSVKCTECPNRRFLAITDETIHHHLSGKDESGRDFVMGLYLLQKKEKNKEQSFR